MSEKIESITTLKEEYEAAKEALQRALDGRAGYKAYTDSLSKLQARLDRSYAPSGNTWVTASKAGYEAFAYSQAQAELEAFNVATVAYLTELKKAGSPDYDKTLNELRALKLWNRPVLDVERLTYIVARNARNTLR